MRLSFRSKCLHMSGQFVDGCKRVCVGARGRSREFKCSKYQADIDFEWSLVIEEFEVFAIPLSAQDQAFICKSMLKSVRRGCDSGFCTRQALNTFQMWPTRVHRSVRYLGSSEESSSSSSSKSTPTRRTQKCYVPCAVQIRCRNENASFEVWL